jgi:nicotinamidase-related amidase
MIDLPRRSLNHGCHSEPARTAGEEPAAGFAAVVTPETMMLRSPFEGRSLMVSRNFIFWEVDAQRDFVLPGGKLYVPGAEKLLPNIRRLTDAARQGKVFLVSHGDFHAPDDPEFKIFPPHCVKGTAGSDLVPEALTDSVVRVANAPEAKIPDDLSTFKQILLEKQTLSIFETLHADDLLRKLGDQDAIETLNRESGEKTVEELQQMGARLITTDEALSALNV